MILNKLPLNISEFINKTDQLVRDKQLILLTLSKPIHKGLISKISIRPVELKNGYHLQLVYYKLQRQEIQNIAPEALAGLLMLNIGSEFMQVNVQSFTEEGYLLSSRKGSYTTNWKELKQHKSTPALEHDRTKSYLIAPDLTFLHELGITSAQGNVLGEKQRKFKQINRFVEIFSSLITDFEPAQSLQLFDMGCGKGYLTFAIYYILQQKGFTSLSISGIDIKNDVLEKCNTIAKKLHYTGIQFITGDIGSASDKKMDILIALHACDTATDDAIVSGIKNQARLIIVAPCCQKQLRHDTAPSALNEGLYRFGLAKEKITSLLTDLIRVNVLRYLGYQVTMQEFIGVEHTPKNTLISARWIGKKNENALVEIREWMQVFGIKNHYLMERLDLK